MTIPADLRGLRDLGGLYQKGVDMRPLGLRYRHLRRYREIVHVLAKHGFGGFIDQMGLVPYLSLPRRLLRRWAQEPPLTLPERVLLAIEELGPTFIKLGQILSTRPDLIPPDFIRELAKLQDAVPPAPWEQVREQIESELGGPIEDIFTSFNVEPVAAASLAQVHEATLPGGEEVVVKVQRPGIEEVIDVDLEILFDLARLAQERTPLGEVYDLTEIAEDFAFTLRGELDYRREGYNADRFRRNFAGEPHLYIPKVYWDYTTRRVLVMERISGIKIDDVEALDAAGFDRHQIALCAARIIVKEVLEDGFFHADPHPGNFFVLRGEDGSPVIGAMDFGMVGHLDRRDRENLIRLYTSAVRLDVEVVVNQLIRMGAAGRGLDRLGLERDIGRLLTKYYGLPIKEIRVAEVVEEVRPVVFRHHLRLPSQFWLLGKTLGMMEGVALKLDPDFDFFAVSRPYVRRFLWQMASPRAWAKKLARGVGDWGEFFSTLPRQAPRLLEQMERGELQITLRSREIEGLPAKLDRVANRLALSVLVAAFIVALATLLPSSLPSGWRDWAFWLMIPGFLAAGILGLWLLFSILRSGRR